MLAIVKLASGILVAGYLLVPDTHSEEPPGQITTTTHQINHVDSVTLKAFQILDAKCNVCHLNRNRKRVFTPENMNKWSDEVYKQVFVRKRMPKGNKIRLDAEEYSLLFTWIKSEKTSQ